MSSNTLRVTAENLAYIRNLYSLGLVLSVVKGSSSGGVIRKKSIRDAVINIGDIVTVEEYTTILN